MAKKPTETISLSAAIREYLKAKKVAPHGTGGECCEWIKKHFPELKVNEATCKTQWSTERKKMYGDKAAAPNGQPKPAPFSSGPPAASTGAAAYATAASLIKEAGSVEAARQILDNASAVLRVGQ